MTARIDLFAPATIIAYGSGASSLEGEPPEGILIEDPGSGTVSLTIVAANAGASLSASGLSGATIAASNNTLTITGLAAQVNLALASLEIVEAGGATSDTLSLTATETGELSGSAAIDVQVVSTIGPAFAAPPTSLALAAWTIDSIAGLVVGDPEVQSLIAAGEGAAETLQLTLSVASGVLLLPNFSALDGISAAGIGTNNVLLTFTADQLAAVNALLAQLGYAGPAAVSGLAYAMRNLSGSLTSSITSGNITLNVTGAAGPVQTFTDGADTVILGVDSLAAGTTIEVTGITSDVGGIAGAGALFIAPDAAFEMPYSTLSLGGTSYDEGTLSVLALNENGTLIVSGEAVIGNVLSLGSAGFIDFTGTLITAAQATVAYQKGLSLTAGAVVTGNGTLEAGNFSNAGRIAGAGTILAAGGDTLVIAAAEISGGARLQIGAGGVMELGPINPLYGVFDSTELTIDSNVTLAFLGQNGADAVSGPFGDNLDERGGVIIINGPDVFSGTIVNFAPGDRLIFPGLSSVSLLSVTSDSFVVAGVDADGNTDEYTINAAYQAGTTPFEYTDNEGDSEVGVRDTQNDLLLGNGPAGAGLIVAQAGAAQPIQGLNLLLRSWTTQSLKMTLAVSGGVLSDGTLASGAVITLTAANPTALDAELEALVYTANGGTSVDELQMTATSGYLLGLSAAVPIEVTAASGTVSGFGDAGEVALFAGALSGVFQQAAAPGEILITGTADFADFLDAPGLAGTALRIDAGGIGILDGAASVALGASATIGDAGGAGFLSVLTEDFSIAGTVSLGAAGAAAGSGLAIAGAMTVAGALQVGEAAASVLQLAGTLAATAATIGAAGTFDASGGATASLGGLADSGVVVLADQARASASSVLLSGTMALEGTSVLTVQNGVGDSGILLIGPDARLAAGGFTQSGGTLTLDGRLAAASVTLDGAVGLDGGTIAAGTVSLVGAKLSGFGDIEAASSLASLALSGATIIATGGMDIGADVSMAGASEILIGAGAALELDHGVAGGSIVFAGTGAELTIDDLLKDTAPVAQMQANDAIDLEGVAPGHVTYSGGSITATDAGGHLIGGFLLSVAAGELPVSIVSDGHGGALITLGGEIPCFARGTRLLTPTGYRPVEALEPGDEVVTLGGVARPVRWIGQRTLDLSGGDDFPIRFDAGAMGPGVPSRPVRLSPLHGVFLDGVLVPALHLVNGATVRRVTDGAVTYFHIELDRHDVVLAEGMAAETYLENGNRGRLYAERGRRAGCRVPCAKLVTSGPALARIRRRLHGIALAAGYALTYEPGLRGVAKGASLLPKIRLRNRRRLARFALPAGAEKLCLVARTAAPAETDPDSEDRRRLGVCLAEFGDGALGAGWLARGDGDAGRWMGAGAEILLPAGLPAVTLELAAVVRRWRPPVSRPP